MLTSVPHFDQWLGVWAIREEDIHAQYQWFLGLDLHVHLQTEGARAAQQAAAASTPDIRDGVEVIGLYGTLMKQQASYSRSTSTVAARKRIRAAARNPDVAGILLHVESPGGTAAGTKELADDIAAAAKVKPVYGYAEDLCASAAFWCLAQCTKTYANPTAILGSIGTYAVVYDYSQMAAKEGIRVHVVRAGEFKGSLTPGTEITPEQLAEQQKIVDALNDFFVRGVAAGRGITLALARELADGRVYVGQAAVDKQLIDGVQSLDDTFSQLAAAGRKRGNRMNANVSTEAAITPSVSQESANTSAANTSASAGGQSAAQGQASTAAPAPAAPVAGPSNRPATLAELRAACQGASNDFLVSQLEANATIGQAQTAWMAKLASENQQLAARNAELEKSQTIAAAAAPLAKPGAPSVPAGAGNSRTSAASGGDAIAQWNAAVKEKMAEGLSKAQAVRQLAVEDRELHQAYLAAYTQANGAKVERSSKTNA